jgi:protein-disulfide isomerase
MRTRFRHAAAVLIATMLAATAHATRAAETTAPPTSDTVAEVDGERIGRQELEQSLSAQLARLDEQRFALLAGRLDELIAERLLAREAQKRGVSVDTLLDAEVDAKTPGVTDEDVTAFIVDNRSRLPQMPEADLRGRIRDYLQAQRADQARDAYVAKLRAAAKVTTYLKEPAPVRANVSATIGFSRGPQGAPVVIVEFSDFGCPYCKSVVSTLKQLAAQYPDKIRWVFRDFPIANLHPQAPKAHEAARCAGAQGKFWEYHDLLFERSPRQSPADLAQYAKDLELDATRFQQCLESEAQQAAVDADIRDGERLGISGTPMFFINGRALIGAQPLAVFQKVIESELALEAAR